MKKEEKQETNWTICLECNGNGKKSKRLRKKSKLRYNKALEQFNKTTTKGSAPSRPKNIKKNV